MTQPDKRPISRRKVLQASAIGVAAAATAGALPATAAEAAPAVEAAAGLSALAATPADLGPGATAPVRPFQLREVKLGDGLLQEKRDRMKAWLR
ncbi:twin-arginine translocation signal domain-containing protein, partial [Micromonospora sp. NPDC005161]